MKWYIQSLFLCCLLFLVIAVVILRSCEKKINYFRKLKTEYLPIIVSYFVQTSGKIRTRDSSLLNTLKNMTEKNQFSQLKDNSGQDFQQKWQYYAERPETLTFFSVELCLVSSTPWVCRNNRIFTGCGGQRFQPRQHYCLSICRYIGRQLFW